MKMATYMKRNSKADILFDTFVVVLSIMIFIAVAYPIYFVIIASISDSTLVTRGLVTLWPKGISFYGYQQIIEDTRIWIGYSNTLLYTLGGTMINLLVTLPAAYALSRKEMTGRNFLTFFFAFTMFFNGGIIPTYILFRDLGLINTRWVFVLPTALNVFNLIIARTFFENSIPNSLYEAAELDGCSHFQFFMKVALPLSKALISVIGLYYLVQHWNNFFTGLIFIRDYDKQPLQIVLRDILISNQAFQQGAGAGGGDIGGYAQQFADQIKYAVIIVSTLPILIVYPFIQKYFDKGVMIGSLKG
ncbi:carbohydrate ABC transporter permease [Marinilactibacillus sp. GCM10026970]|uniref:carbohydrate ABC transporter permease n=1 Tax=Marinilactibacillus sp. GCM10026970 TaxID=3252642 RepID=UPI00361D29AB